MNDQEWLKNWRVENCMSLTRVPAPRAEDTRQAREWDHLRFGLRQRFSDQALVNVPIVLAPYEASQ